MVSESAPLLPNRVPSDSSIKSNDERFADQFGMDEPEKSIGPFQSFVLIANNVAGPGLMGLPLLYEQAGILPVTLSIIVICVCASFVGTLLSETIANIPKNSNFERNIEYSGAFRIIMGKWWYALAEFFFLVACMVQVFTGLVETAQSLDGFIASYLIGETYALSLYPSLKFVAWSSAECVVTPLDDCTTPFAGAHNGTLIVTLGYAITCVIFLPFGRGHIKETMMVQLASFAFLVILLLEFDIEFIFNRGLNYSVGWFGEGEYSQLVGVILFNYAFAITIPAWLSEKTPDTHINRTIWRASMFSSFLYITFGMLAAFSFHHCSADLLTLLSSNEVSLFTRISAAFFGLTIIGAGVPVFCVIIKNTLYSTGTCDAHWSLFFGSIFPYLTSWCLYKGELLIEALNWAGLVVNGFSAFCLPLLLGWWYFSGKSEITQKKYSDIEFEMSLKGSSIGTKTSHAEDNYNFIECSLPEFLIPYRTTIIVLMVVFFVTAIFSTIATDFVMGVTPS